MPLGTRQRGVPGPALPGNLLGAAAPQEVSNAIGRLNAGNLFGGVGGIAGLQDIFGWRVDRQNAPGGFVNISVQRNGEDAPSTVASVFVPVALNIARPGVNATAGEQAAYRARLRELERAVRRGLEMSFASMATPAGGGQPNARVISRYEVHGAFSA